MMVAMSMTISFSTLVFDVNVTLIARWSPLLSHFFLSLQSKPKSAFQIKSYKHSLIMFVPQ